jgi:hypothetical protein
MTTGICVTLAARGRSSCAGRRDVGRTDGGIARSRDGATGGGWAAQEKRTSRRRHQEGVCEPPSLLLVRWLCARPLCASGAAVVVCGLQKLRRRRDR